MLGSRQEVIHHDTTRTLAFQRGVLQRAFDVTVASLALLVLLPLLAVICAAVALDDGRPVFFFQERVGRDRRRFRLCKFRSMHADAGAELHRQHVKQVVNGEGVLRLAQDPRVTRMGRIIRRWSLDELPNLWNVIRGDMSLVGPRPLVPYEANSIQPDYHGRFTVRPGITGLAQVSGRLDMTHEERLDLDVAYARRRNLWMDFVILLKTVPSMLRNRG